MNLTAGYGPIDLYRIADFFPFLNCLLQYWMVGWLDQIYMFYYPLEVRTLERECLGLGVFLLQYFPLVNILKPLHYNRINMNIVG